jgi:hypothetical protein
MNKIEKFEEFKKKYQYISKHNKFVKKCGFDSTILDIKVIPIVTIYKFFKNLLIKDNTQLNDDNLILLIIYILAEKFKLDFKKTKLLHDNLQNTISDFKILKKRFSLSLDNLLIISNIVYKDIDVINNFDKFLNFVDIYKIIEGVNLFSTEHNIGLKEFSFIIYNKKENVLKNIIKYLKINNYQ